MVRTEQLAGNQVAGRTNGHETWMTLDSQGTKQSEGEQVIRIALGREEGVIYKVIYVKSKVVTCYRVSYI